MNQLIIYLLVVLFAVVVCNVGLLVYILTKPESCTKSLNYKISQRIVGGKRININQHPFMAALVVKKHGSVGQDSLQCGASIIALKWVISAAHCITLLDDQGFGRNVVYISAGNSAWRKGRKHTILSWHYHEKYDEEMSNDIALIRVKEAFDLRKLERPVTIASKAYRYKDGAKVKVIGWGVAKSSSLNVQQLLLGVDVYIFNQTYCAKLYKVLQQTITPSMFCAGVARGGKDACQFDSGGPIFDGKLFIGIVSWGIECGVRNQPGVYTRINLFRNWINKITKKFNETVKITYGMRPKSNTLR